MTVALRGSEPFTPEVSIDTNRNLSPLRGVVAPTEWLQIPQSTPLSSTSFSCFTESPSRQSSEVFALKLTTVAVVRCGVSGPATVPIRYPATKQSAPPATNTGVGRVTFPTAEAWHAGCEMTCSGPGGSPGPGDSARQNRRSVRVKLDDVGDAACGDPDVLDGDLSVRPTSEHDPVPRHRRTTAIAGNAAQHRTGVARPDFAAVGQDPRDPGLAADHAPDPGVESRDTLGAHPRPCRKRVLTPPM